MTSTADHIRNRQYAIIAEKVNREFGPSKLLGPDDVRAIIQAMQSLGLLHELVHEIEVEKQ